MHWHIQQLLMRHGLIAVFLGSAVEGDFSLLLAGVVSHLGFFTFPLTVLAGTLGSLMGDSAWYALGRLRVSLFREGNLDARMGPTVERLAGKMGPWHLVAARFVYGTKAASMVFWGLHGLPLRRFLAIDLIGCVLGSL